MKILPAVGHWVVSQNGELKTVNGPLLGIFEILQTHPSDGISMSGRKFICHMPMIPEAIIPNVGIIINRYKIDILGWIDDR